MRPHSPNCDSVLREMRRSLMVLNVDLNAKDCTVWTINSTKQYGPVIQDLHTDMRMIISRFSEDDAVITNDVTSGKMTYSVHSLKTRTLGHPDIAASYSGLLISRLGRDRQK